MYSIPRSTNKEIAFYGRVVDQHGDPVVGMAIHCETLAYQTSLAEYSRGNRQIKKRFTLYSDDKGYFKMESERGASFSIEKMEKEGYTHAQRGVSYSFVYSHLAAGDYSSMYHYPDPKNPVVFEIWKKGVTEPIIKDRVRLRVKPEKGEKEVFYSFDLNSRPTTNQPEQWDIKLVGENRGNNDWEYTIEASEGSGLQITEELYANMAPESGYKQKLNFKSSDLKNPRNQFYGKMYFKGKKGEKYAVCDFTPSFSRPKNGSFSVHLTNVRINPNGSRNLEYDPEKEIRIDDWAR